MSLSNSAFSRWTLLTLAGLALLVPSVSSADSFRGTQVRAKSQAQRAYNSAASKQLSHKAKVKSHRQKFKDTGNKNYQRWTKNSARNVLMSKIKMRRAEVNMLRAEAQLAHLDGDSSRAKTLMHQAAKAERKVDTMEKSFASYEARKASGQSKGGDTVKYPLVVSNGNAVLDPNAPQKPTYKPIGAGAGLKAIKRLVKANNLLGATEVHERIMAKPSRKGIKGVWDNRNKRAANKLLINAAYKMGKRGAKAGDLTHLQDAKMALAVLNRMNGYKDPKTVQSRTKRYALKAWQKVRRIKDPAKIKATMLKNVGLAAATGAKKAAKRGDHETMQILHQEAMKIPGVTNTLRYKWRLSRAAKKVMKGIKLAAKQGNLQAFDTKLQWYAGYAEEKNFSNWRMKRLGKKLNRLSLKAVKRSVTRDLDDALRSLDPMSRTFNPTAARMLREQALQKHESLTLEGHKVKIASLIKKVDKALNKHESAHINGQKEVKKPGFIRRGYERLFVSHHKRTEMPIANLDAAAAQGAGAEENLGFDVDKGPGLQTPGGGAFMNNMQNNNMQNNNMGGFGK